MMLTSLKKILVAMTLFVVSIGVFAAVPSWQINPADSHITFTATQNNAPVTGTFKTFTGDIQFDPANLSESKAQMTVDLASVSTSYAEIQDALKGADWFNVKMFPQAVFKTTSFKKVGDKAYSAEGTLTIRDKTIPITLAFTLEEYSAAQTKVKGTTTLKRTQFGVGQGEWAKTDGVKDEVNVEFVLKASKKF